MELTASPPAAAPSDSSFAPFCSPTDISAARSSPAPAPASSEGSPAAPNHSATQAGNGTSNSCKNMSNGNSGPPSPKAHEHPLPSKLCAADLLVLANSGPCVNTSSAQQETSTEAESDRVKDSSSSHFSSASPSPSSSELSASASVSLLCYSSPPSELSHQLIEASNILLQLKQVSSFGFFDESTNRFPCPSFETASSHSDSSSTECFAMGDRPAHKPVAASKQAARHADSLATAAGGLVPVKANTARLRKPHFDKRKTTGGAAASPHSPPAAQNSQKRWEDIRQKALKKQEEIRAEQLSQLEPDQATWKSYWASSYGNE